MASIKLFNRFDLSWIYDTALGNFISAYSRPLLVLMLNQLLILAIDLGCKLKFNKAYFEKHYTHSRCQTSILNKAFVYLILNMLIIPGVTMATAGS